MNLSRDRYKGGDKKKTQTVDKLVGVEDIRQFDNLVYKTFRSIWINFCVRLFINSVQGNSMQAHFKY